MTRKFAWLEAAQCRLQSLAALAIQPRTGPRARLDSSNPRSDPHAHALRGCTYGLLVGTYGSNS
ncbi:MAG: hypothetical protein KGI35_17065 [Burkholderiales bacterium]|nr:hypothetical protein [Burkholderiales bacterium]